MFENETQLALGVATNRLSVDGLACRGPALLYMVLVSNGSGGASLAKVYDGESTAGDQVCDIDMLASTTFQYHFHPPMYLRRGLYIVKGTNATSVTVRYHPLRA